MNTFWAIVANALVIGGAVFGVVLFQLYVAMVPSKGSRPHQDS